MLGLLQHCIWMMLVSGRKLVPECFVDFHMHWRLGWPDVSARRSVRKSSYLGVKSCPAEENYNEQAPGPVTDESWEEANNNSIFFTFLPPLNMVIYQENEQPCGWRKSLPRLPRIEFMSCSLYFHVPPVIIRLLVRVRCFDMMCKPELILPFKQTINSQPIPCYPGRNILVKMIVNFITVTKRRIIWILWFNLLQFSRHPFI